jgi:excisionase family DNA binding protein
MTQTKLYATDAIGEQKALILPPDPCRASARLAKRAFSVRETEQVTGLSHSTIYELIKTNKLKTIKVLGRRLITAEALDELLKGVA